MYKRQVQDDVYTSIHIEEYEAEARDTKLGPEEITRAVSYTHLFPFSSEETKFKKEVHDSWQK